MDIKKLISENEEEIIETRRHLHKYPELSKEEFETSKFIQSKLNEWGISFRVINNKSVIADITGEKQGDEFLGIRADIDALPIKEETNLSFSSKIENKMHACGHDCHTAILLESAKLLNSLKSEFGGKIRFIFQESEETISGALDVIKADGIKDLTEIIGLHMEPLYPVGTIEIGSGIKCMKWAGITVNFIGKGGHASEPWAHVNPLNAGVDFVTSINNLLVNEVDRFDFLTITPTVFNCGTKENIISDKAQIVLDCRYFDNKFDEFLKTRIPQLANEVATKYSAKCIIDVDVEGNCIINDETVTENLKKVIESSGYKTTDFGISPGGEDFSEYQQFVKGCFIHLGSKFEDSKEGLHSSKIIFDENALKIGTEIEVKYALEKLKGKEIK